MKNTDYEKLRSAFLSFTAIDGDLNGSGFFEKYFTAHGGIAWLAQEWFEKERYGGGVDTILFQLYIEGNHNWFKMPSSNKLGAFSKSSKSWRYNIPLCKEKREEITNLLDMKIFIADAIRDLIKIFEKKSRKMPDDFNLDMFLIDLSNFGGSLRTV